MSKNFVTQEFSGAFGNSNDVPWNRATVSDPMTLRQAEQSQREWKREMAERCGNGWDSHFRIVPLQDVEMTATWHCWGYYDGTRASRFCPDYGEGEIIYIWPAGQRKPHVEYPSTWRNGQCPACATRDGRPT